MRPDECMLALADAFEGDAPLSAWVAQAFGKPLTIWAGSDPDHPPTDADYPFVCVDDCAASRSTAERETVLEVLLVAGVSQPAVDVAGRKIVRRGAIQARRLLAEVEDAALRARLGHAVALDGETASDQAHPFYLASAVLRITIKNTTQRPLP